MCAQSLSHAKFLQHHGLEACQAPLSMEFSRQEYWIGLPFSSPKEIFPTQGLNSGLQHCRQTLYCLNHQGSSLII